MNEDLILSFHQHNAVGTKTEIVKQHGPMNDVDPFLTATFADNSQYVAHPTKLAMKFIADSRNMLGCIVHSARALWLHKGRIPLMTLGMVLEGYEQTVKEAAPVKDLGKDYKYNPASTVSEVLLSCICENDAVGEFQMWTVSQCYAYSDGGIVVFKEPRVTVPDQQQRFDSYDYATLSALFNEIGRKP